MSLELSVRYGPLVKSQNDHSQTFWSTMVLWKVLVIDGSLILLTYIKMLSLNMSVNK